MHYGIIAAGEGSRLTQEGVARPKPLVRLCGVPMIERLIGIFMDCGAESISVIVNEQMKEVREYVEQIAMASQVPVRMVVKSTPSSMHSFYELSRIMGRDGKFILTTVDTIFLRKEFDHFVNEFEKTEGIDALMPVTDFIDDEKPLYVATDDNLRVTGFLDAPAPDVKYVSGGIYGLTPAAFGILERCVANGESRMRNFQRALLTAGLCVKATLFDKIVDVDHADDIRKAEQFLGTEECGNINFNNSERCLI